MPTSDLSERRLRESRRKGLYDLENEVLPIVINRSKRNNALTGEMYLELNDDIRQASADEYKAVDIDSGARGGITAGNDLDDFIRGTVGPTQGQAAPKLRHAFWGGTALRLSIAEVWQVLVCPNCDAPLLLAKERFFGCAGEAVDD